MPLKAKQARFVTEYLIDLNATSAAIRAGYSQKTADRQGHRLLKKAEVAREVQKAMDERAKRKQLSQDYVLDGIIETIERCKQAAPVEDREGKPVYVETPAGKIAPVFRFEPYAVLKGYELLGKHLKLFVDRSEVDVKGKLVLVTNVPEPKRGDSR